NKIPPESERAALYVLANVSMLPGVLPINPIITVAWSLSYEMFFYLLLPAVISLSSFRARSRRHRVMCLFLGLVLSLTLAPLVRMEYVRCSMFLVGILLHEALQSSQFTSRLSKTGEILAIGAFAGSLVLVSLLAVERGWFSILPGLPTYFRVYTTCILCV